MDDQTKPQKSAPAPKAAEKAAPSLESARVAYPSPPPTPADALLDVSAYDGAVENDNSVHYRSTQAHTSSAWVKGPGAVTLLVEAGHDLNQVAALRGTPVTEVQFVRALALPAVKTVLVWPTDDQDLQKIPVTWRGGQASFNVSEVLIRAQIPVQSGRRKRFEVRIAKETLKGPALAIDMRFLVDLRITEKSGAAASGKGKGESPDDDLGQGEE